MDTVQKRTWAEIDLGNLEENYRALRKLTGEGCRFLGVVKANAYGHGAIPVARRLEELGAEYLAVACLDEAVELRQAGLSGPILILGVTPPELGEELIHWDLTQSVGDLGTAEALSELAVQKGKRLKVHVKADTGMSRLGFLCTGQAGERAGEEIVRLCRLPGLEPEGIFTHFANADGDETFTMLQFQRFMALLKQLEERGIVFQIRHCAASAAVLNYPCTHLDMIRPGIALYGHYPAKGMERLCPLKPVMSLKTRIYAVRELPAGSKVSYGCTRTLERESKVAVLPVGYADGLPRLVSDQLQVSIRGRKVPLLGRVCMDMCMADVTSLPEAAVGDIVAIYGDGCPAEPAAELAGTISYELLCRVAPRVPRVYKG